MKFTPLLALFILSACSGSVSRDECYKNVRDSFKQTTDACTTYECIDSASELEVAELKECK